jgi:RecA-family ATPase
MTENFTPDKIPPQAVEVEQAILASFLNVCDGKKVFERYKEKIAAELFYDSFNQKLFRIMLGLNTNDEITLSAEFQEQGEKAKINALTNDIASSIVLDDRIDILLDRAKRRQRIAEAETIISDCRNLQIAMPAEKKAFWFPAESRVLITRMLTTEPEPFNFVVSGLLPKGVCGFLYGEGGSYKSLAALWLGIQRAAGFVANSKWLDRFEIAGAGRSMFCSVEDQQIDIHHRIKAIVDRFAEMRTDVSRESIVDAISENFHVFPRERWMMDGAEHIIDANGKPTLKIDLVSQYAKDQGVDLIVLDTLSRLSLVDENDNNGGARLVAALERIRDDTGAAVLVIAHSGKIGRQGKTDVHGQNGMRGASALMDNARFGLWFRSLSSKGGPAKLEILNSKTFRARRADPFQVTIDYPAFTLCQDDDQAVEDDLMNVVVEDVKANPGTTQKRTRARLKKAMNPIKQGFDDAVEEGLIIYQGRGKGYVSHA